MIAYKGNSGDKHGLVTAKKKIMLVDDHPLVGQGLKTRMCTTPDLEISWMASNAPAALQMIAEEVPDLMILDISLPGTSGLDLLKDVKIGYPDLPVLVLSMHEESVYAGRVLRAGAKGYIMKQEPGEKVIEAIRCVLSGGVYASPALVSSLLQTFASDTPAVSLKTGPARLGDRELQVYTLIGNGLSTKEIASQLNLSTKTVQTYREHIKRKLGLSSAMALVHSATQWIRDEKGV